MFIHAVTNNMEEDEQLRLDNIKENKFSFTLH